MFNVLRNQPHHFRLLPAVCVCYSSSPRSCYCWSFVLHTAFVVGVKWYLILFSICVFLMTDNVEYLACINTYWPFVCLLWKTVQILCPFLIGLVIVRVLRVLYTFYVQVTYKIDDLQTFLPVLWLSFHFIGGVVYNIKVFEAVQFISCFLLTLLTLLV